MSFASKRKAATRAESERIRRVKECGCLACRQEGLPTDYAEAHHLNIGDKHGAPNLGHAFVVGLCPWHHRGVPPDGRTIKYSRQAYGPSLALEPRAFRERYGSGDALMLKQERVLKSAVW